MLAGWRPSLNSLGEKTTDRTGSPVVRWLTEISEYHAVTGHYETVVDLDKDTNRLPDWVSGERVLYVGKGDVDAVVDFGELDKGRIVLSEDSQVGDDQTACTHRWQARARPADQLRGQSRQGPRQQIQGVGTSSGRPSSRRSVK